MRDGARKIVPEPLRHIIVPVGTGFELRTCWGYVLRTFGSLDEAREFYAWHCPIV